MILYKIYLQQMELDNVFWHQYDLAVIMLGRLYLDVLLLQLPTPLQKFLHHLIRLEIG